MRPTMSLLPRVLSIRLGGWLDLGVPVRHALCEADGRRAVAGLSEHLLKGHISPDEAVRAYSTACDDCELDLWNKIKRMMIVGTGCPIQTSGILCQLKAVQNIDDVLRRDAEKAAVEASAANRKSWRKVVCA